MTELDRGKEYEPDLYADHEEEYDDYDVEEEEEGGSRAAVILLLVIGVVLLGGVAYVSYNMGVQTGRKEGNVPQLAAATDAGKVRPENPGGLAQPQESALDQAIVDGSSTPPEGLLLPPESSTDLINPETPQPGDFMSDEAVIIGEGEYAESLAVPGPGETAEATPQPQATEVPTPAAPAPQNFDATPTYDTAANDSRIIVPSPGGGSDAEVVFPSEPSQTPAGQPVVPQPGQVAPNLSGSWVVQLASLPSVASANDAWTTVARQHSDLLASQVRDIKEVDLGSRGIFYRLRVGYFENRGDANSMCSALKSRGQDCLVAKR